MLVQVIRIFLTESTIFALLDGHLEEKSSGLAAAAYVRWRLGTGDGELRNGSESLDLLSRLGTNLYQYSAVSVLSLYRTHTQQSVRCSSHAFGLAWEVVLLFDTMKTFHPGFATRHGRSRRRAFGLSLLTILPMPCRVATVVLLLFTVALRLTKA